MTAGNEEIVLRIQQKSEKGEDVKNELEELYLGNLRFICTVLLPYQRICGETDASPIAEDVLQEAYFSVTKAAMGYRFDVEASFITFLGGILKRDAVRYLRSNLSSIRIPEHITTTYHAITKTREELTAELGRPPTRAELLQATRLSNKKLKAVESAIAASRTVSLDSPISGKDGDTGQTVGDFIPDPENDIDEALNAKNRKDMRKIWHIMGQKLTERQMLILQMHDADGLTYYQIAQDFGVSSERIRQIREEAINKLMTGKTRDKLAELDEEIYCQAYHRPGIGLTPGSSGDTEALAIKKLTMEENQKRRTARNLLTATEARKKLMRKCSEEMRRFIRESEQAGITVDYVRILQGIDKQ